MGVHAANVRARFAGSPLARVVVRSIGLALLSTLIATPLQADASASVRTAAREDTKAIGWVVECAFVRHLTADPIVFPGQPDQGHLHDFFGNTTTDAFSTYGSLVAGTTTCALPADTGAYWVPAAIGSEGLIEPSDADFYYRASTDPKTIHAFPRGLRMIAGDGKATGPQSLRVVYWDCEDGGDDTDRTTPVDCQNGIVSAHVRFPDCWNGVTLDSVDHRSHMAYSVDGPGPYRVCPKTHPEPVPRLIYKLQWPYHDGNTLFLSSGPAFTLHADFVNSWRQRKLKALVSDCLRAGVNCGTFDTDAGRKGRPTARAETRTGRLNPSDPARSSRFVGVWVVDSAAGRRRFP